jgi:RNA polymerase sigma-70 factor, ECF subfamily
VAAPDVTVLLRAWADGDAAAFEQLVPLVHRELHKLARVFMAAEGAGHTLQPTALLNEAYLRLIGGAHVEWRDRAHFFATSARLMRRVLVDVARSKRYLKRGGGAAMAPLDDAAEVAVDREPDLVALDLALEALAEIDSRKSRVVELRFFGGLSVQETALALEVSPETVHRDWQFAKSWLRRELRKERGKDRGDGY